MTQQTIEPQPLPQTLEPSSPLPLLLDLDEPLLALLARRAWQENLPPAEIARRALRETLARPPALPAPAPPRWGSEEFWQQQRQKSRATRAQDAEADRLRYEQFPQHEEEDYQLRVDAAAQRWAQSDEDWSDWEEWLTQRDATAAVTAATDALITHTKGAES